MTYKMQIGAALTAIICANGMAIGATSLKKDHPLHNRDSSKQTLETKKVDSHQAKPFSLYRWVDQLRDIQKRFPTYEERFERNGARRDLMNELAGQMHIAAPYRRPTDIHNVAEQVADQTEHLEDYLYYLVFKDMATLIPSLRNVYPYSHIPDQVRSDHSALKEYKEAQANDPMSFVMERYLDLVNLVRVSSGLRELMNDSKVTFPEIVHERYDGIREGFLRLSLAPPNNDKQRKAIVEAHPIMRSRWDKFKERIDDIHQGVHAELEENPDILKGHEAKDATLFRDFVDAVHHQVHLDEKADLNNLSPIWMDYMMTTMHDEGETAIDDVYYLRTELEKVLRSGTKNETSNFRRYSAPPYFGKLTQPIRFMPTNVDPEAVELIERLSKVQLRWLSGSHSPTLGWWKIMFKRFGERNSESGYTAKDVKEFVADVLARLPQTSNH